MPYIGKRLRELRLEKKMTQEQLAKALGLSKSAIVQYEHNKREPNLKALISIENFFNVSSQFLTNKSPYKKISEDMFYNRTIQSSERFHNEGDATQRRIISISNSFTELLEKVLDVTIPKEKDQIIKQLYTILNVIKDIAVNDPREYAKMYEGNCLNELDFYKLQEAYFSSLLSDLEELLKNIFEIRFENIYKKYVEKYPAYAGDEEYIEMIKSVNAEIDLEKTEKYGKLL